MNVRPLAALATVLVVTAGCGGSDAVMPDVESQRLDVALSDIKRAGFEDEVEVLGGGTFGVVDESAWTVCQQEPAPDATVDTAPRLTVDRECGGSAVDEPTTDPAPSDEPEDTPTPETSSDGPSDAPTEEVQTFVMPALVGANLQDAQDLLQTFDSYLLSQVDARGLERFQVLDSGWKVCGQRPVAGRTVSIDRMVKLFVVKLDEVCP